MKPSLRILSVIGTRPDAIKMAPLIHLFNNRPDIDHRVCSTGQHAELLDSVLTFFEINPDYQLGLMTEKQDINSVIGKSISAISSVLADFSPDWVLVHGDTATCLGATLAAFYKQIKVGHIEAGLRSGSLAEPFPEESIRILTDQLSEICFVPTDLQRANLIKSGKPHDKIITTGNTVIDSLYFVLNRLNGLSRDVPVEVSEIFNENCKVILITIHRSENQGANLLMVCEAIRKIVILHPDARILIPLHPNPRVSECIIKELSEIRSVVLCTALSYPDFIWVMKHSYLIITDSGGIQEEAPVLTKPVFLLRNRTERPEMVTSGNVKIVGVNIQSIIDAVNSVWVNEEAYKNMAQPVQVYGDGKASEKIADFLFNY